jgi:hypothetical protein
MIFQFGDGLIGTLLDIFFGANDWKARLQPTIKFTSPAGNEFEAKWIGGPRTMEKKLGIFVYPRVIGNVVQDLDVNSTLYSLTIYFDGKNNDTEAQRFFLAAKERGQWKVEHPVQGPLQLQLISITENNEPVRNGGITEINTEWIEPIDPAKLLTAAELQGLIDGLSDDLDASAIEQFVDAVNDASETLQAGINQAVQGVQNVSDFIFSPLTSIVDSVDNTFNTIQNGITDTLNATVLQAVSLGGQIQQLIQTPLLVTNDIQSRNETYLNFTEEIIGDLPTTGGANNKNLSIVNELALMSTTTSMAKISSGGIAAATAGAPVATGIQNVTTVTPIVSRAQAVDLASQISDFFDDVTNSLDNVQALYDTAPIENQYFSQSKSYSKAALLMAYTQKLLLLSTFDLKVEKRFILDRNRSPIEIALSEYGGPGDNDQNIDLFNLSNNLKGKDIVLLPAGREVVVYV